ncbi:MAG: hypothetical protein H7X99_12195 [Saprospiraceae bacterium]|nr:hypothetical protein [Saprospiraceae bacterium]
MRKFTLSSENIFYIILGAMLLFLITRQAIVSPITHDEVNTIDLSQRSVWDIVTYTDPVPNNHILNTLLLKAGIAVFGDSPLTDRLFNILFFIPFFIFAVLISKLLFNELWIRLAFVLMISLQPYLLDFFGVTRGYGISVALEMVSLYYFFLRLKSSEFRPLVLSVIFAALAVYANFTLMNYFIPLVFLLAFHSVMLHGKTQKKLIQKDIFLLLAVSVALVMLCYLPFTRMIGTNQFVYWGSTGFFTDTVKPLIISLRSGTEYFGWSHEKVSGIVTDIVILVFLSGLILIRYQKEKKYFLYSGVLLLSVIVYNHLQFYVLDIPFLNARTALFFIPLVVLFMGFCLQAVWHKNMTLSLVMSMFLSILAVQHFIRGFNVKSPYEWGYDETTYDVLNEMNDIVNREQIPKPVKVNCHWIFYPSLSYHIKYQYADVFELVPYHKDIQAESDARFYYTEAQELEKLSAKFEPVKDYGWRSRFLLKSK